MRSAARLAALVLGVAWASAVFAAHPPRAAGPHSVDAADLDAAVQAVQKDPALKPKTKMVKSLHWKNSAEPTEKPERPRIGWLDALLEFLADSGRLLFWVAGALLAALALVWVLRVLRQRVPRVVAGGLTPLPSHVQNLDVRPASLPADIAAAAATLLAAGQIREALSLLYRGALSRAIHQHGIAIAESSTEGDVLTAVAPRLSSPGADYFGRLIGLWQRTAYGAELPASEAVSALCRDFPVLEGAPA